MFIKTAKDIGILIREARRKSGLSQTELARKLNASQGWISEVEAGKATAEIGMVLKTLVVLGIKLDARPFEPPDKEPPYTLDKLL